MRVVAGLLVAASLSVCPNANAENSKAASTEELFRQYGLFGTWAVDCNKPATPRNPHVSITTPSAGLVLETHNLGADFAVNRYSVLSAQPESASSLSVEVLFQPGTEGEERQKLVFSIRDNTRRTIFNQTSAGVVRVKDGIALARGTRTPTLHKCQEEGGHALNQSAVTRPAIRRL